MKCIFTIVMYFFFADSIFASVRVCSHELPPHTMSINGSASGFATEVLHLVAKELEWDLKTTYSTWNRLIARARNGECDLVYTILKKPEYELEFSFPDEPIHLRKNVLLVLQNSKIDYNGNLKLFMQKYSIGTYYDKAVSPEFDKYKKEPWAKINYSNKPEENFLKLINNRFDAAIENNMTAAYYLRKIDKEHLVRVLSPAINTTPAYIAFSKNGLMNKEIKKFSEKLKKIKSTKEFISLEFKYMK